jgi:hypothetical protein
VIRRRMQDENFEPIGVYVIDADGAIVSKSKFL